MSPSQVARFYFHECERYLRFRSASKPQRRVDQIPEYELDRSLLTKAILEGGNAWEQRLLDGPLEGRALIADSGVDFGQGIEPRHSPEATIDLLRNATPGMVIYQPTLQASNSFYETYGIDRDLVSMRDCYPDLLIIEEGLDGLEVRVIDAKASDMMKLSHRIQVGLYSILLEHVLVSANIDSESLNVSRLGGVWLYEQPHAEWFELSRIRGQLETFLAHDLTRILSTDVDAVPWHLYFRCEWCDYYQHCRTEAETRNDVSLVPYLSTFAKRHLGELGVDTVAGLNELLGESDAAEKLVGCSSLEGKAEQLSITVDAMTAGDLRERGSASVGMPVFESVLIVVTVQSEPLEGQVYGYSVYRFKGADLFGTGTETRVGVASDGKPETLRKLRSSLVRDLIEILRPIHEHNASLSNDEWKAKKSLQAYVFDTYEEELLIQTLIEAVVDGDDAEDALALLFHFQHADISQVDDHPATEVFFPIIAINAVVRSLLALPIPVVYRFADVVTALQPSTHGFTYNANDFFSFALSNRMKSNAIFEVWERGRDDLITNIEGELKRRVWAANSVISGLRERLEGSGALFAWPPKFQLPVGFGLSDPVLSRLAFITRYEVVLACLDARNGRARPRTELLASGTLAEIECLGGNYWRIDEAAAELAGLRADDFSSYIVTRDDDDGNRARLGFDDFVFRDKMHGPARLPMALAAITELSGDRMQLKLTATTAFAPNPVNGERCLLEARFTDWTSDRVVTALTTIERNGDHSFTQTLREPLQTRKKIATQEQLRNDALALAKQHGMTESQYAAFVQLVDHDLQLVWGPPGTGKTHFLALALLCLTEAYRKADQRFRIIVVAQTHTAIDNVLSKVAALHKTFAAATELPLFKVKGRPGVAQDLNRDDIPNTLNANKYCVIGTTVWQLARHAPASTSAELILIDEGSQVKVGEAAIAQSRRINGGRLVIAGDPEQLPPIVHSNYPVVDGEPPLHRSILECLRAADPDGEHGLVAPLLENFRMNEQLCAYPAASIYPSDYRPATPAIADGRLAINMTTIHDDFLRCVLDPEWPVVICVLENVKATRENPQEAILVEQVVEELRHQFRSDSDAEFWNDRVFVVCPHHAQIRLIRNAIHQRLDIDESFVDTVDRMQGQECDAVVVSYGVSDVEYALSEKEFIYSRNRLNVAMTRARHKSILFVSRRLLEPPIQALEQDDVADGIAFMQGLARHCEASSAAATFVLDGVEVTVLRA